jgi:hypothetical protein
MPDQLFQDLRYALRTMASNPVFTLLVCLSLGLSIGENTAIYSVMDSILLRSLPVHDPETLVGLNWHAKAPRPEPRAPGIPPRPDSVVHFTFVTSGSTSGE